MLQNPDSRTCHSSEICSPFPPWPFDAEELGSLRDGSFSMFFRHQGSVLQVGPVTKEILRGLRSLSLCDNKMRNSSIFPPQLLLKPQPCVYSPLRHASLTIKDYLFLSRNLKAYPCQGHKTLSLEILRGRPTIRNISNLTMPLLIPGLQEFPSIIPITKIFSLKKTSNLAFVSMGSRD